MKRIELTTPLTAESLRDLQCGDLVYLTGIIYTARDAAHKKMIDALDQGEALPFSMEGAVVYYAGPSPTPPGKVIGSIGPTTSGRMDSMTAPLLERGLLVMIGKGARSEPVMEAMKKKGAVYLAAVGGAGALLSKSVKGQKAVAYEELGTEAVRELTVEKMPLIVAIDARGQSLYKKKVNT